MPIETLAGTPSTRVHPLRDGERHAPSPPSAAHTVAFSAYGGGTSPFHAMNRQHSVEVSPAGAQFLSPTSVAIASTTMAGDAQLVGGVGREIEKDSLRGSPQHSAVIKHMISEDAAQVERVGGEILDTGMTLGRHIAGVLLLSGAYVCVALLSGYLPESAAVLGRPAVWLPTGLVLAVTLAVGGSAGFWAAPGCAVYTVVLREASAVLVVIDVFAHVIYPVTFLCVVRGVYARFETRRKAASFHSPASVLAIVLGSFAAAALAAALGVTGMLILDLIERTDAWEVLYSWALSDSAGALVLAPLLFSCGELLTRQPGWKKGVHDLSSAAQQRSVSKMCSTIARAVGSIVAGICTSSAPDAELREPSSWVRSTAGRALQGCFLVGALSATCTAASGLWLMPSDGAPCQSCWNRFFYASLFCAVFAASRFGLLGGSVAMSALAAAHVAGHDTGVLFDNEADLALHLVVLSTAALFAGSAATRLARLSDALRRSRVRLRAARAHAEDTARTKTQFLANMSHELRTPLNGIIGNTRVVMSSGLGGEERACMQDVLTSADHLLTVLNDILLLSRMEFGEVASTDASDSAVDDCFSSDDERDSSSSDGSVHRNRRPSAASGVSPASVGKLSPSHSVRTRSMRSLDGSNAFLLTPSLIDLQRTTEEAVTLAYDAGTHGHINLILNVAPTTPLNVIGDATRIRQALYNLLSNALKFVEEGEVELSVSLSSLSDSAMNKFVERDACRAAAGYLRRTAAFAAELVDGTPAPPVFVKFSVRDTGIGIAPEEQPRVFDAFRQVDDGFARRFGGTGLGLAITHRLVRAMGGCLSLTSEVGVGSNFTFIIPLYCVVPSHTKKSDPKTATHTERPRSYRNDRVEAKEATTGDIVSALRFKRRTRALRDRPAVVLHRNHAAGEAIAVWLREAQADVTVLSHPHAVESWAKQAEMAPDSPGPRVRPAIVFVDSSLSRPVSKPTRDIAGSGRSALPARPAPLTDMSAPLGVWLSHMWPTVPVVMMLPKSELPGDKSDGRLRMIASPAMASDIQAEIVNAARWAAGKSTERSHARDPLGIQSFWSGSSGGGSVPRTSVPGTVVLDSPGGMRPPLGPSGRAAAMRRSPVSRDGSDTGPPTPAGLTSVRVLVVEDNRINQRVANRMLKSIGCDVVLADDGMQALQQLGLVGERERAARDAEATGDPFCTDVDFVLMDMQMPVMDGMAATREIRKCNAVARNGRRLPVVALTANAFDSDRHNCIESGMDDFLTKPISRPTIVGSLADHVPHMHGVYEDGI